DERLERQPLPPRTRRELDLRTPPLTPRPDECVDASVVDLAHGNPPQEEAHRQARTDGTPLEIRRANSDRPRLIHIRRMRRRMQGRLEWCGQSNQELEHADHA